MPSAQISLFYEYLFDLYAYGDIYFGDPTL